QELAPTWYTGVPTMHGAMLERIGSDGAGLRGRLRFVRSSSAALATPIQLAVEEALGGAMIQAYGVTGAAPPMTSNPRPPGTRKTGSVGVAGATEVAVLGADGCLLPAGDVGHVAVRGPNVFDGYERNPEANEEAFSNGWFRTGDLGFVDDEGYLFLSGRVKEIINR